MTSSIDDERIAGRLDEDQERLLAAVTPHGFELRQPRKRPFEDFQLEAFEAPDNVLTRLSGEIDGAPVDLFEYDWVRPGNKGRVDRGRRIVAVVRHPAIDGTARCTWETFQSLPGKIFKWTMIGIVFLAAFWLLIPLAIMQHLKGKSVFAHDWRVGDDEFDKRFKVDGPSHAKAVRALPAKMQALALATDLRGPIEVRPAILALAFEAQSLDPKTFEHALAVTKKALATYAQPVAQPGLAYRVASESAPEPEEESDETTEEKRLEK